MKRSKHTEKRVKGRIISKAEQEALEHAPFFDAFCVWVYTLAKEELARKEAVQSSPSQNVASPAVL